MAPRNQIVIAMACIAMVALPGNASSGEPGRVYEIETLTPFESGDVWSLDFQQGGAHSGYSRLEDLFWTAAPASERYLFIHYAGPGRTGFRVQPETPVFVSGYTRSFALGVRGNGRSDEISIELIDQDGRVHTISLGRLDYHGWRKLVAIVPPHIRQRGPTPRGDHGIRVRGLFIRPALSNSDTRMQLAIDELQVERRDYARWPDEDDVFLN